MIWNWFWILNDDDYKRSPSTETKDKRTRQTLCGDEASAQTHTGDGGVNCNSAALTGPSLNNRKAEMWQKYKKKNSHSGHVAAQTSSTLHTHVSCVLMRSLHGSTQPEEPHFNIHYYYYHDYNIHSLIRTPGLQTSTQAHVSTLWHLYCRRWRFSSLCSLQNEHVMVLYWQQLKVQPEQLICAVTQCRPAVLVRRKMDVVRSRECRLKMFKM